MRKQSGAAAIMTLLLVFLAISGLVTVLKLMPLYSDDWTIASVFERLQEEAALKELSRSETKERIQKRFSINSITEFLEHVEVVGQGSTVRIEMNYERRVSLAANIELVATFTHNVILSE